MVASNALRGRECKKESADLTAPAIACTVATNKHKMLTKTGKFVALHDSGANVHVVTEKGRFYVYKETHGVPPAKDASGQKHRVVGVGTVRLGMRTREGGVHVIELKNVRHIPTMEVSVVAESVLRGCGYHYHAPANPNTPYVITPTGSTIQLKHYNGLNHYVGATGVQDYTHPAVYVVSKYTKGLQNKRGDELLNELSHAENKHEKHAVLFRLAQLGTYASKTPAVDKYLLMHARLGHASARRVAQYAKQHNIELDPVAREYVKNCVTCAESKMRKKGRSAHSNAKAHAELAVWEKVYTDVWVPGGGTVALYTGYRYALGFICAKTSSTKLYGMRSLTEVPEKVKTFLHEVHSERNGGEMRVSMCMSPEGVQRMQMRSDAARYYLTRGLQSMFEEYNVKHDTSAPHHPEQNAKIERLWGTLDRMQKAMRRAQGRGPEYWWWAMEAAARVHDILPLKTGRSPKEMRTGKAPTKEELPYTWGAPAVARRAQREKRELAGRAGVYVGYNPKTRSHKVYYPATSAERASYIETIDLSVLDKVLPDAVVHGHVPLDAVSDDILPPPPIPKLELEGGGDPVFAQPDQPIVGLEGVANTAGDADETGGAAAAQDPPETTPQHKVANRPKRARNTQTKRVAKRGREAPAKPGLQVELGERVGKLRKRHPTYQELLDAGDVYRAEEDDHPEGRMTKIISEPKENEKEKGYRVVPCVHAIIQEYPSLKTALAKAKPEYQDMLKEANSKEWKDLISMGVIEEVMETDIPSGARKFPSQMILVLKGDKNHKVERAKGRLVINGSTMRKGEHYYNTSAYCPTQATVRAFLAVTASKGRKAFQADISNAYCRAPGDAINFMRAPHDQRKFVNSTEVLYKVSGNLYGSKSGAANWNKHLNNWLKLIGFKRSRPDPALYVYQGGTENEILLCTWVDDLGWSCASTEAHQWFEGELTKEWGDCKVQLMSYYLGMNVIQTEEGIHISHKTLIERAAKQFGIEGGTSPKIPMKPRTEINAIDCPNPEDRVELPYREITGVLQYLAITTKPGVAYAASQCARVQSNPAVKHYAIALDALKWCNGTKDEGVFYRKGAPIKLEAYCDSSFADTPVHAMPGPSGTLEGRKSTEGYILMLGDSPIHWWSRRQTKRAYSSTEAEAMAAASATKDIIHKRRLMVDLCGEQVKPTKLHIDNQPCLDMLEGAQVTQRNKHCELDNYVTHEAWKVDGIIQCQKIATENNTSDLFTKPLDNVSFTRHHTKMVEPEPNVLGQYRIGLGKE